LLIIKAILRKARCNNKDRDEKNLIFSHTVMDRVYKVNDSKRDEPLSEYYGTEWMFLINNWQMQDANALCVSVTMIYVITNDL